MAADIRCPECQARTTVPDEAAGKRLRCRKCNAVFRAPGGDADEAPKRRPPKREDDRPRDDDTPRPRRPATDDDEDDEDERPARTKRKKAKKSSLPFVLGVLAALLLVAGAIGAVGWSRGWFAKDEFAEAERPAERKTGRPLEDYSEHVVLRFVGLDDWGGGRLYPKFEYESRDPNPTAAQLYALVYRQPHGEYTSPLKVDAERRLKGGLTVPYTRVPEMTVYVAKKRISGKQEEWVRVSNIIQFPDALGKR